MMAARDEQRLDVDGVGPRPLWKDRDSDETRDLPMGRLYPLYFSERILFTRFNLFLFFNFIALITAFKTPIGWAILVGSGLVVLHCYRTAGDLARHIQIKIGASKSVVYGETMDLEFEILNPSSSTISHLSISLELPVSSDGYREFFVAAETLPGMRRKFQKKILCDGAMGDHILTEFKIRMRDPLGLFEICESRACHCPVRILPKSEAISNLNFQGSPDSPHMGDHQRSERGVSVNFMGVREYKIGDPLKIVSWKLSAKHRRLMVKEFEKTVSEEVTIFLEMNPKVHAGSSQRNSWEIAKKMTLNLMGELGHSGEPFQVVSQGTYIPFGGGLDHFYVASEAIMNLNLKTDGDASLEGVVSLGLELVPYRSSVVYVTPMFHDFFEKNEGTLDILLDRGCEVLIFAIDAVAEARRIARGPFLTVVEAAGHVNDLRLAPWVARYEQRGVRFCKVTAQGRVHETA